MAPVVKDNSPEKQISPFSSSVLTWEFEAEPEPATHFSNLSTSQCLHDHYYFTSKTYNSFLTGLPHPQLCFRLVTPA